MKTLMNEYWLKIKEWWSNLSLREKQATASGSTVLILFIFYQFMWSPFLNHLALMRKKIQTNEKVLVWMQAANQQIQKIETQTKPNVKVITSIVLMGDLQKQINQAGLGQFLQDLKQGNNDSVELHFQKVDFDKLVKLLTMVVKKNHVFITQLSAQADTTSGMVNADIVISLSVLL